MSQSAITCPNCGTVLPAGTTTCPECHEDLAPLLRVRFAADIAYNEGLRRARSGDLEGAIVKIHEAVAATPAHSAAYIVLGKLYAQKGIWSLARWWWQQALDRWPEDEVARRELAALDRREARLAEQDGRAKERQEWFRSVRRVALVGIFIAMFVVGLGASWAVVAPPVVSPVASPLPVGTPIPTLSTAIAPTPGSAIPEEECILLSCILNRTPTAVR
jgi:hypothetical protein